MQECSKSQKYVVLDVETTGLDFRKDRVITCSISKGEGTSIFYFPDKQEEVSALLADSSQLLVGHNIKFDLKFLSHSNVVDYTKHELFDTMVGFWLLEPKRHSMGLKKIARDLFNSNPVTIDRTKVSQLSLFGELDKYCESDIYYTNLLYKYLIAKFEKNPHEKNLFYEIEMPYLKVLINMEMAGVRIDTEFLGQQKAKLTKDILKKADEAFAIAGQVFNINSSQQIAGLIFGNPKNSADNAALTEVDSPLAKKILEYRKLFKLYSGFVAPLSENTDGIIHCDFIQTGTVTSRLASSNPNLQNIPSGLFRKLFIAREGKKLIVSDFSSLELRVLAHLIKDITRKKSILVDAIEKNLDPHTVMASYLLNKKEISKEERKFAKTITFGIIYGMNYHKLSERLEISEDEAINLLGKYYSIFPEIKEVQYYFTSSAKCKGYVENPFGFKRWFGPEDKINTEATNAVIQSTAAYITKSAQLKLMQDNPEVQQLIQVHDELVCEVDEKYLEDGKRAVTAAMENAVDLSVPLVASTGVGDNWYEAKA